MWSIFRHSVTRKLTAFSPCHVFFLQDRSWKRVTSSSPSFSSSFLSFSANLHSSTLFQIMSSATSWLNWCFIQLSPSKDQGLHALSAVARSRSACLTRSRHEMLPFTADGLVLELVPRADFFLLRPYLLLCPGLRLAVIMLSKSNHKIWLTIHASHALSWTMLRLANNLLRILPESRRPFLPQVDLPNLHKIFARMNRSAKWRNGRYQSTTLPSTSKDSCTRLMKIDVTVLGLETLSRSDLNCVPLHVSTSILAPDAWPETENPSIYIHLVRWNGRNGGNLCRISLRSSGSIFAQDASLLPREIIPPATSITHTKGPPTCIIPVSRPSIHNRPLDNPL